MCNNHLKKKSKKILNKNAATAYVKKELSREFTLQELAGGAYRNENRTWNGEKIVKKALSPSRLNKIMANASAQFSEDYKKMKFSDAVNEKCRKAAKKVKDAQAKELNLYFFFFHT